MKTVTAEEILRKYITIPIIGDISASRVSILQAMEEYRSQPSDVSDEIKRLKDRGDMLKEQFRLASLKIVELSKRLAELEVLHYGEVQFPVKSGQIKPTIEVEKSKGNHVFIKYFDIYIDQELHKVKEQFITGSQIKSYAKVPNNYGVWLKGIGKESDREISDNEQVDLNQPYRDHFFTGSKAITEG